MARFDCRVAKLTILRISKIRKLLDEGGNNGIDKDLIGDPGGRKRVERDNRSRKTKRRVRKANSVFGAGCNERGTDRRNVPRVIDTACAFSLVALCSKVETDPAEAIRVIFSSHHCASGRPMSPRGQSKWRSGNAVERNRGFRSFKRIDVSFSLRNPTKVISRADFSHSSRASNYTSRGKT